MTSRIRVALAAVALIAAAPDDSIDGLRSGLDTAVTVFSLGAVTIGGEAAQDMPGGALRFPLTGFLAPRDAAMTVSARQGSSGVWDITTLSFPSAGALGTSIDHALSYTLGTQAIHGQVDPEFSTASTLEASLRDLTFERDGAPGTIKQLRVHATGQPDQGRVEATFDTEFDGLSMAAAGFEGFTPRKVTMRTHGAGLDKEKLARLLHLALAPDPDREAVRRQLAVLLAVPGTVAELQSLDFDSGPLHGHVTGRLLPGPSGDVGAELHVTATGADALLTSLAANPKTRTVLPVAMIARGFGKVQGQTTVWDIKFSNGVMTVNGSGFGQPPERKR